MREEMGDIDVDLYLETLKQLIMNSKLPLIRVIKHHLQSLEMEIKYLREFLKVTEKKRNEDVEVMNLVMHIRGVIFESENIVDMLVDVAYHLKDQQLNIQDKFWEWCSWFREFFLYKLMCIDEDPFAPYDQGFMPIHIACVKKWFDEFSVELERVIEKEIKTLTAKVKQIYDKNMYDIDGIAVKQFKQYSFTGSTGGLDSSGLSKTFKVAEEKMVGFEKERDKLLGQLHNSGKCGWLEIISIVGAAGGGKTTLAREVYQHPLTLHAFEIRAWVVVSQDYNKTTKRDMLISILKLASQEKYEDYARNNDDILGEKVHKCLKGRKYLIVMDDMWSIEAWNDIQRSFPKEFKGSKVLFTSRLLVESDIDSYVHYLAPLQEHDSWDLLQKKVFGMKLCPPELVDIGKQIVVKCEGLPVAIVAIAGILATEDKTPDVWKGVAKRLSSIIADKQKGCMEILELSYNHLPLHLKACFLYMGAFPEDCKIPAHLLMCLWIAEGFIQQSGVGKSLEAIAEDYLTCLIDRSLVMVVRKRSNGMVKACHVHDLLRQLCLIKAKEDNFLVQIYKNGSCLACSGNNRRLFIGSHLLHKIHAKCATRFLRSFLCFSVPSDSILSNLSILAQNFRLLKVLHVPFAKWLEKLQVDRLVHLRYLAVGLAYGNLFCLPNSFHYLSNLEILAFYADSYTVVSLPPDIVKMVKLRHLSAKLGTFQYHHVSYDEDEGNMLDSLQTLKSMCICEHCLCFLRRTPNLRKLKLRGEEVLMLPDLEFLKCLETIYVDAWVERMPMSSTGLKLPLSLTRLTLRGTHLEWEELSIILQTLPSLEVLKLLSNSCLGPVWDTSELEEGFSRLKYLRLEHLGIEKWSASEDQFPTLEVLLIKFCRKLKGIPIDFANLNELHKIEVRWSSRSTEESATEIQEEQRSTKGDDDCVNLIFSQNDW